MHLVGLGLSGWSGPGGQIYSTAFLRITRTSTGRHAPSSRPPSAHTSYVSEEESFEATARLVEAVALGIAREGAPKEASAKAKKVGGRARKSPWGLATWPSGVCAETRPRTDEVRYSRALRCSRSPVSAQSGT